MEEYRETGDEKISEYRRVFKQSVNLVSVVFGKNAFYLNAYKDMLSGKYKIAINQGLFDVLMYGFTIYDQHQVMPFKDEVKAKLFNLMADDDFVGTISGAGTGTREKFIKKVKIWLDALEKIIGQPKTEPRFFSINVRKQLWEKDPVCSICQQHIESFEEAEVDHIEFYSNGGKTEPGNARLTHRYCNRSRREEK